MAKFVVSIMETNYGSVEVEAYSTNEARNKAEEEYHKGNVCWSLSEFSPQKVEEN